MARPVFIIDGSRTPFLKARSGPGPFTPVDLAVQCGRPLLARQPFAPTAFDQVILGCVNVIADEMNPARVAALRLGMGEAMVAFTVQINCGSGMQSIDTAYRYIREGTSDLILAGGAEALSHAPLVWPQQGVRWFAGLAGAKGILGKLAALAKTRPAYFKPIIGLERGLTDPITELNMGQTAEVVGHLFGITREQSDAYAVESHKRLANAQSQGCLKGEVETAFARDGKFYDHDDGVRPDSSPESLAKLKPVFERPWGQVTAGNSSQITDGASWTILASEEAVAKHGLTPKAVIIDSQWSALDPSIMGLGPVLSATELLKRNSLSLADIETWELNEAFATQVLGCLAAWNDEKFCREILGLDGAAGQIDHAKLNVDGGAISLGHPVGLQRQPHRAASRQCDEAARHQARHRHRMHRRRAGRRHVDRDGVIMDSRIMDVLGDRVLELGPKPDASGPYRNFKLTRDTDGIAWLLFDREGASANTLSADVIEELDKVLAELEGQRPTGLVIRSAKPSGFIAGADVNEFRGAADPRPVETAIGRAHAVIDRLEGLKVPSVAIIHGFCLGGGLEVALACQSRIAIDGARFGFPEVMLGLHPGLGGTVRFTQLVNPMQAMTLMLTGKTIDARRAKSLGLVDAVAQERHVRNAVKDALFGHLKHAKPGLAEYHFEFRSRPRFPQFAHARGSREGGAA